MSEPAFSVCGEILGYAAIATWLITWAMRRLKYNKNAYDKQMKGWLNSPENQKYLQTIVGAEKPEDNAIPDGVKRFMEYLNQSSFGDSFLDSVIPEEYLSFLDSSVRLGYLSKETYKDIGTIYTLTDKGKGLT